MSGAETSQAWTATWGALTAPPRSRWVIANRGLENQTLRQMVFTTAGGQAVRVRISNRYGTDNLQVGGASVGVALRPHVAELVPDTGRALTFDGAREVTVPAGGEVTSDPVAFDLSPHEVVVIDLYFAGYTGAPEYTFNPIQAAYSASGDHTGDESAEAFAERVTAASLETNDRLTHTSISSYLVAVEVLSRTSRGCIVVAGDSLTFGRWPQWLARRLEQDLGESAPAVAHLATSGIKLCSASNSAPNFVSRFESDVLSVTGISQVIVSVGFNDLAIPSPGEFEAMLRGDLPAGAPRDISADDMIAQYESLLAAAHARDVPIVGCTIPPGMGGVWDGGEYAVGTPGVLMIELWPEENEEVRRTVNRWMLEDSEFDGVIDVASVIANPRDHAVQHPLYSDDGTHVGVGGWYEIAQAIDLDLLRGRGSRSASSVGIRQHRGMP